MLLIDLYIGHLVFTIFLCLINLKNSKLLMISSLVFHILFLMLTRTVEFKQDLINYQNYGSYGYYSFKEPVFLYLNKISYLMFGKDFVFLITDTISVIIIYKVINKMKLNYIYFFLFISFFPVIMGFQSVYRQHFGCLIALFVISNLYEGYNTKYFYLRNMRSSLLIFLAPLSHNVNILPFILYYISKLNYYFIIAVSFLVGFIIIYFYEHFGKASIQSGDSTSILFILALILMITIFKIFNLPLALKIASFSFVLVVILFVFDYETPAERTGLIFLTILWPFLALIIEKFKPRQLSRIAFALLGFVPLLISQAKTLLLQTI